MHVPNHETKSNHSTSSSHCLLLLLKSPVGLIYAFSALLVLLAIWQVSQVKADIGNNGQPINNDPKQKRQQRLYWFKPWAVYGLSAFSVFFMQSPSFLQQQRLMHKQRGINNVNTLFGTHKVPSDNQIRNLMDTVPPDHFYPIYRQIFSDLNQTGYFESFKVLDKQLLIAFDGTSFVYH